MTQLEFLELVAAMRATQTNYFKTRSKSILQESKALERQVDAAVSAALEASTEQVNLAIPTPRQLEIRAAINDRSIESIALLNDRRSRLLPGDIARLREVNQKIEHLLDDLDISTIDNKLP